MRTQLPILLVAAALLPGCAIDEYRAYRIDAATARDAAKVQRILRDIAQQAEIPKFPRSLPSYQLPNVWLRANIFPDHIDVYLQRTDWPPPHAFTTADGLLAPALSAEFGHRFHLQKPEEQVIVTGLIDLTNR